MDTLEAINQLAKFLARRDIEAVNAKTVDLIILLGNALPYTIEFVADLYHKGIGKQVMIVGGKGHSTTYLWEALKQDKRYTHMEVENQDESELFKRILVEQYHLPKEALFIENQSTNCGNNATYAIEKMAAYHLDPKCILIIQDPTMQMRSHLTFMKYLKEVKLISFAPFIPYLKQEGEEYFIEPRSINGLWDVERFISLVMGEIPRLRNDVNGYGPKGMNFIFPIELPPEIEACYSYVQDYGLQNFGHTVKDRPRESQYEV
ncbi:YdcF family protein [Niameybacter massiliensis]|uniref:YdcF family protein n=1 Tax=Niameybacter massiliensis TaxID=1658108 RepID=UPI0006B65EC1|nr:YdcF family protein [Niameybacter massiliensis]